jgi:ElaB/YqjD/DUF883 family membrane-anchored ribosome-binding protein
MLETTTHSAAQPAPQTNKPRTAATPEPVSLTETADQAVQSLGTLYTAVDAALQKQVQANPYATLGVAAGVGFVLGGGLASPMGQMLLRVGVRAFGPPLVNALIHGALERAQLTPATDPNAGPRQP